VHYYDVLHIRNLFCNAREKVIMNTLITNDDPDYAKHELSDQAIQHLVNMDEKTKVSLLRDYMQEEAVCEELLTKAGTNPGDSYGVTSIAERIQELVTRKEKLTAENKRMQMCLESLLLNGRLDYDKNHQVKEALKPISGSKGEVFHPLS
jgi:hypothetical protein